jgi:hypothetical protein
MTHLITVKVADTDLWQHPIRIADSTPVFLLPHAEAPVSCRLGWSLNVRQIPGRVTTSNSTAPMPLTSIRRCATRTPATQRVRSRRSRPPLLGLPSTESNELESSGIGLVPKASRSHRRRDASCDAAKGLRASHERVGGEAWPIRGPNQ